MRICYIANAGSLHTYSWLRYFAENGHQVYLVSLISNNPNIDFVSAGIKENFLDTRLKIKKLRAEYEKIGVEMYPLDITHPFKIPIALLKTRRYIRRLKPDIVHAHYVSTNGFLGTFSGFHPFVITAWGSDIVTDVKGLKKRLITYALKGLDLITCDGGNLRKALIELGAEPQKIYRICWGTDTRKFNPEQRSEKIREDLGISNSPTIISSKNLEPGYDIESLVKSIPLVLKKVPEAKFVIAGRGSQETELKQLAKSLGVSDSVRFVGWIPSDEYPQYLASADIYVCTSLSDGGLAISTKEAMACELPVVITDLEVNTEWIKDEENGFIVSLKDPKTLAEKITYLIEHEDIRMKFGELGRKMVKERFEYDKELKKVENLYEQLIREHKK